MSGWGRYPVVRSRVARPERRADVFEAFGERNGHGFLAHGLGRSYGDAALIEDGQVVLTRRLDRMLAFDPDTGWLRCEAGVSIEDILEVFVPRGFFPPVTPGTKFVTVGGALGCDVHGKSHHVNGCWSNHVRRVELLTGSGDVVFCDAENEPELFAATAGGMGLTGVILSLEVKLARVASPYFEMDSIR
ncbi:MAG: FAD-binding oxidoreductase, partial [Myxococcales bacterium]|nr:FAD-binding oxidoreductase [Myxococcales bacterium]